MGGEPGAAVSAAKVRNGGLDGLARPGELRAGGGHSSPEGPVTGGG